MITQTQIFIHLTMALNSYVHKYLCKNIKINPYRSTLDLLKAFYEILANKTCKYFEITCIYIVYGKLFFYTLKQK